MTFVPRHPAVQDTYMAIIVIDSHNQVPVVLCQMVADYFDILLIIRRFLEIVLFNVKKCPIDTRLLHFWNSCPYLRVLLLTGYPFSPIPELHQPIFETG